MNIIYTSLIELFLPYNNFIVLFSLAILNIYLISRQSYWQTFLITNLLLLAFLAIIGFNPVQPFIDIISRMIDFISYVIKLFGNIIKDIIGSIF